ncbi:MAG: ABC transporter permease [Bacteroidales bacterium]|nr:ABC transporter permease [Bacteroidales bacterium]
MLRNFFKVSIRNLIRNKTYSIINILGLSIGMACSILIFLFIFDELSYDKYHENSDDIYRVGQEVYLEDEFRSSYAVGFPAGRTFADEIPEIINFARVLKIEIVSSEAVVKLDNKEFIEKDMFFVDNSFLDIFDVKFIDGDAATSLNEPYQLLITESLSKKYFGEESPLGKVINIRSEEYIVSGLIEDCPANSHFHYSVLISMLSNSNFTDNSTWVINGFYFTYLLLEKGADVERVAEKVHDIAIKHDEKELKTLFDMNIEDMARSKYILQPLTDIHLHSHSDVEIEDNSNISYIYIFSLIAFFILVVACINFMNLSTARAAKRAKEVGIRKVIGAMKGGLFWQFMFESIILSAISLIVAMLIVESVLPFFNSFIEKELTVGYSQNILLIPLLLLLAIVVGLFSGFYSAGYLSSIKILSVIKSSVFSGKSHSWFRNILVIFQFSVSIFLFICTFIIYSQLLYIKNKDTGLEKENVLVINSASKLGDSYKSFKEELEKHPRISGVTYSSALPGGFFNGFPAAIPGENSNKDYFPKSLSTDYDFAETYNLKMKEGRFFSDEFAADSFSIVINESAVKEFGLKKPVVGKQIISRYNDNYIINRTIVGVVKNFNFRSLHQEIGSLVITPNRGDMDYLSVKFKTELNNEAMELVKTKWNKFVMDAPFDYSVLEDVFINMHKEEFKTGEIFALFSILAIFIACLGVYGLVSFMAEQKTKEIGIRKVLGSSTSQVVRLLLVTFTKWVLMANVIAWPVAYFFMNKWLQNFAYRVNIQWWIFIASGILGLLIAVLTVSFQAIKAARTNPVNSLRYE